MVTPAWCSPLRALAMRQLLKPAFLIPLLPGFRNPAIGEATHADLGGCSSTPPSAVVQREMASQPVSPSDNRHSHLELGLPLAVPPALVWVELGRGLPPLGYLPTLETPDHEIHTLLWLASGLIRPTEIAPYGYLVSRGKGVLDVDA